MSDRIRCVRCGAEIWWWKAYWRRGEPDASYCSRRCAVPQYNGDGRP